MISSLIGIFLLIVFMTILSGGIHLMIALAQVITLIIFRPVYVILKYITQEYNETDA